MQSKFYPSNAQHPDPYHARQAIGMTLKLIEIVVGKVGLKLAMLIVNAFLECNCTSLIAFQVYCL